MIYPQRLRAWFPSNAILRSELAHQHRSTSRRRWLRWLSRLLTGAVWASALFFVLRALPTLIFGQLPPPLDWPEQAWVGQWMVFAVIWTVILHFSLMFETLSRSANVIAREKQGNTWELLLLTGTDARAIVMGKWWATVRRMRWWYLSLGILRALMIVWVTGTQYTSSSYFYYGNNAPDTTVGAVFFRSLYLLVTFAFVILMTLLNLGFTAACGLSASADHRNSAIALARAIGTRILIIIAIVGIPIGIVYLIRPTYGYDSLWSNIVLSGAQVLATFADNGVVASYALATYNFTSYYYPADVYTYADTTLLAMLVAPLAYAFVTALVLRFARRRVIRQGALPPPPKMAKRSLSAG